MAADIPQFSYQMNVERRIELICAVCGRIIANTDDECDLRSIEESHRCVTESHGLLHLADETEKAV